MTERIYQLIKKNQITTTSLQSMEHVIIKLIMAGVFTPDMKLSEAMTIINEYVEMEMCAIKNKNIPDWR